MKLLYRRSEIDFHNQKLFALDFIHVDLYASVVSSAGTRKAATGLDGYAAASTEGAVRRIVAFDF
jgi:hypothetical protein